MNGYRKFVPGLGRHAHFNKKERIIQQLIILVCMALVMALGFVAVDKAADAIYGAPRSSTAQIELMAETTAQQVPTRCNDAECSTSAWVKYRKTDFRNGRFGKADFTYSRVFKNPVQAKRAVKAKLRRYFNNHPRKQQGRSLEWWARRFNMTNCIGPRNWDVMKKRRTGCRFTNHDGPGPRGLTKQEFEQVGDIAVCGLAVAGAIYTGGGTWIWGPGMLGCTWIVYKTLN